MKTNYTCLLLLFVFLSIFFCHGIGSLFSITFLVIYQIFLIEINTSFAKNVFIHISLVFSKSTDFVGHFLLSDYYYLFFL